MAFGHFLLGSHNFMVSALGLVCEVALNPNNTLFVDSHRLGNV